MLPFACVCAAGVGRGCCAFPLTAFAAERNTHLGISTQEPLGVSRGSLGATLGAFGALFGAIPEAIGKQQGPRLAARF